MSKEETTRLLEAMLNDGDVAERVAQGDFSDLAPSDLTEAEQALLSAAGSELADSDVSGFSFLKLGDIQGESALRPNDGAGYMKIEMEKVSFALDYVGKNVFKF